MPDEILPEEWRPVEGWPYEISSFGRVRRSVDSFYPRSKRGGGRKIRSPKGFVLSPIRTTGGYLQVRLIRGRHARCVHIHVLACTAFHGERPSLMHEAAHWDGDKTNNATGNLRWATALENAEDRDRHGRTAKGEKGGTTKLSEIAVREIRALVRRGVEHDAIASRFGVARTTVTAISRNQNWAWLSDS